MPFEFRFNNSAVIDTERNIILYGIGSYYGKGGDIGGGARFELQLPQGCLYAHLFLDRRFPTSNSITLHWEPHRIECEETLRGREKEVLSIFAEALQYYPSSSNPAHIEKITTDFDGWEQRIQFKESLPSHVKPMKKITA